MDKEKARAIAEAILQPDLAAQAQLAQRRQAEQCYLQRKRRIAAASLVGAAAGTIVAILLGERFTLGIIYGALAGSALAWVVQLRRARQANQQH